MWSDASEIVVLNAKTSTRSPNVMPAMQNIRCVETVKISQELTNMLANDFDPTEAASNNPQRSSTQLSPRIIDGNFDMEGPRYDRYTTTVKLI